MPRAFQTAIEAGKSYNEALQANREAFAGYGGGGYAGWATPSGGNAGGAAPSQPTIAPNVIPWMPSNTWDEYYPQQYYNTQSSPTRMGTTLATPPSGNRQGTQGMPWWERGLTGLPPAFIAAQLGRGISNIIDPRENIYGITSTNPTAISPYAAGVLEQTGGIPKGVAQWGTPDITTADRVAAMQAMRATTVPPPTSGLSIPVRWDTITDPDTNMVVTVGYDEAGNVVSYEPIGFGQRQGMTEEQQAQLTLEQAKFEWEKQQAAERVAAQTATTSEEAKWRQRELDIKEAEIEAGRAYQQQLIEMQRQQHIAQLQANPSSWLEYSLASGQTPAVQPWMLPLSYQDYGFQLGQPIPNWNPSNLAGLPELMNPSAQYWARLSPSQRAQYMSYAAAQKGMRPQDVEAQMWGSAPSGGGYGGLRQLSYNR